MGNLFNCNSGGGNGKLKKITLGNRNFANTISWTAPASIKNDLTVDNFFDGVTHVALMARNNYINGVTLNETNYNKSTGVYTRTYTIVNDSLDFVNTIQSTCYCFYIE